MNKCELPLDLKELFQLADAIKSVPNNKAQSKTDLPEMVDLLTTTQKIENKE